MKKAILSIKPEFCEAIFSGRKKFEYRRRPIAKTVDSVIIYETKPTQMLIGEFEVLGVYGMPKEELWNRTKHRSGITKEYFDAYFSGLEMAYAIRIGYVTKYPALIDPKQVDPHFVAPQSFRYIDI